MYGLVFICMGPVSPAIKALLSTVSYNNDTNEFRIDCDRKSMYHDAIRRHVLEYDIILGSGAL